MLTIVGGVVTAITFPPGSQGVNYRSPRIDIVDPTNSGSGAAAVAVLDTTATPPTVVGVRCMSENAQHATQGPKRSLATIISFEGDSYHEASERMEKFVKADQFGELRGGLPIGGAKVGD